MCFRPGPTQTGLYSHRRWLEAANVEELYYPCGENKGADQLRSYCEADLRLCFRLCRLLVFPCGGSYNTQNSYNFKANYSFFVDHSVTAIEDKDPGLKNDSTISTESNNCSHKVAFQI